MALGLEIATDLDKAAQTEPDLNTAELMHKAAKELRELCGALARGDEVMKEAIKKAIKEEREACASIVDQAQEEAIALTDNRPGAIAALQAIAARIRTRRPYDPA